MKKRVFCHFCPRDGVEITQKQRFQTRSVQLPLFLPLTHLSSPPGGEMLTGNIFGVLFGCRGTFWGTHSVTLSFFIFDNIYMFIMAKNGNFQFSGPLTKKLGGDGGVTEGDRV